MNKILVIGDSLSMARLEFGIGFDETYAHLLHKQLQDSIVINASLRANDSRNVLTENYSYETFESIKPELVIYFLGIVDCMPRLFTTKERLLLRSLMAVSFLKSIGKFIVSYRSKRRYELTKKKLIQFVSLKDWATNLEKAITKSDGRVIFVNIPYPGPRLLARNYRILDIVNEYNAALRYQAEKSGIKVIDFYSMTKDSPDLLLEDGYHITVKAHQALAGELLKLVPDAWKKSPK
jgi:lysophospholipase L1-like esterase